MKKLIMFSICVLIFTGCGVNTMSALYSNDSKISSDTNSFNLNEEEQRIDNQEYIGQLQFEGMDTIWKYDAEEDINVEISYNLSVTGGKAKLVLIYPEGKLETIVENKDNKIQEQEENTTLALKEGNYTIKLVGANKAQIDLRFKASAGNLHTVGF